MIVFHVKLHAAAVRRRLGAGFIMVEKRTFTKLLHQCKIRICSTCWLPPYKTHTLAFYTNEAESVPAEIKKKVKNFPWHFHSIVTLIPPLPPFSLLPSYPSTDTFQVQRNLNQAIHHRSFPATEVLRYAC